MNRVRLLAVATSAALAVTLGASTATGAGAAETPTPAAAAALRSAPTDGVTTRKYDLGVIDFDQPGQPAPYDTIPVRLWGSISVPEGPGPFPVVVIAHGSHFDGCPPPPDAQDAELGSWPCWDVEQRNDLGFAYVGRQLAAMGVVTVIPDFNSVYTGAWGATDEPRRFDDVLGTTLQALNDSSNGIADSGQFGGIDLAGKVDAKQIALVGHSRGGWNSVKWAKTHPAVKSLFLLAPYQEHRSLPDLPTTVTLGTCDADTRSTPARYARRAANEKRTKPVLLLRAQKANHNDFNRTLVRAGQDDAALLGKDCQRRKRVGAKAQQAWMVRVVRAHLRWSFLTPRRAASYMRPLRNHTQRIKGVRTIVERVRPSA